MQRVCGEVAVNGVPLRSGDGAAVTAEERLTLTGAGTEPSEILLFDLA